MNKTYDWAFPLPRTHTGVLLGNGVLGLMVWGEANVLRITINRSDFWDHRGGREWTDAMSFANIRAALEANDAEAIKTIFAEPERPEGHPNRPTRLPLGRFELHFDAPAALESATLELESGDVVVRLRAGERTHALRIVLSMHEPIAAIDLSDAPPARVKIVTCWDYPEVAERLGQTKFDRPTMFDSPDGAGWTQTRPSDEPPLTTAYRRDGACIYLTSQYGAKDEVSDRLARAGKLESIRQKNLAWWRDYWNDVPTLALPEASLQFLYDYGMYKFAGLSHPDGIAAGLQGPWVEEYQLPPWSADYHFNINVQMCYQPAYQGNRLQHLRPLFDLIESWTPVLRDNAKRFVGIDDGLMLPHAVDDRCRIIGAFWTGTIDHACAAWVGKMMFDYWSFGGADDAFLRDRVFPFLAGAMRVFEEMLERDANGRFVLPISVSPEYRGASLRAWGRNASFQLAAIHWLIQALQRCCKVLNIDERPVWREIQKDLPKACVESDGRADVICLWQGLNLEESHRHHSHLAGLTPFDVIDPQDPEWRAIVGQSINHWIAKGPGMWTGWCMPWAVMLHHRAGNPDMANLLLEIWRRVFTNQGHGTLHDCNFRGFTLMGAGRTASDGARRELMQMDAGMGVVAAILDGMCHTQAGVLHVFRGVPSHWRQARFDRVRIDGAALVSAEWTDGRTTFVELHAERAGQLRFKSPWKDEITTLDLSAGQRVRLTPA